MNRYLLEREKRRDCSPLKSFGKGEHGENKQLKKASKAEVGKVI